MLRSLAHATGGRLAIAFARAGHGGPGCGFAGLHDERALLEELRVVHGVAREVLRHVPGTIMMEPSVERAPSSLPVITTPATLL
jgi:hypothetical protein